MTFGLLAPRRLTELGSDVGAGVVRASRFARSLGRAEEAISHWDRTRMSAAASVDEALLTVFQVLRSPPSPEHFGARLDDAHALVDHLWNAGAFAAPTDFHQRPDPPSFQSAERRLAHVRYRHVAFVSPYTPDPEVPAAQRFRDETGNRIAHAWILDHGRPAPWIVCVHGAGMGEPIADIFAFRAGALHRAGFNVAIPVLPHHGPRGTSRVEVAFPTDDPALNLHGATQAIADVRAVLASIDALGAPALLLGISLGGYVAAAVAALEPAVRGVVIGVPVVDLSALLRRHAPARFARHPRFDEMCETSQTLEALTSPLSLARPATDVRRVWAGRADRLVRPDQVQRIVDHWQVTDPYWYSGGHTGFLGLPSVQRLITGVLVDAGLGEMRGERLVARPLD